jgi:hypothetical protein
MQIRIKQDDQQGSLQLTQGQVLNLPRELAGQFIADGKAVEVPKAERAIVRGYVRALETGR